VRWRARTRSAADEQGAVIVEAAVIFPLLFLIVFGALEFGLLFRDDLTGSNVVRAGGRALSAQTSKFADQSGMQALLPAATGFSGGLSKVSRVVVYIATCASPGPSAGVTASRCGTNPPIRRLEEMSGLGAACIPAGNKDGVTGYCNVYDGPELLDSFANDQSNWGCLSGTQDRFWCPDTRVSSQKAGTDYVGIHIEYEHEWVTGLFGSKRDMTDDVIFRVEPQGF
jgi:hypothetical protein